MPGPQFPLRLEAAIEAFEASELACEHLGNAFVTAFAGDRRWQLERFQRTVTDWELQMFAEGS